MTANFKKAKIFYTTQGFGKPLVLLHGFLESSNLWEDFISNYPEQRQIISIDLPGHGRSGCLGEVHTMELLAEAVQKVLGDLGLEKADFVGHSMGGYVALAFVEKYPGMMGKLILVNSTPAADTPERQLNRDRAVILIKKNKKAFIRMAISNLLPPGNQEKFKKELKKMTEEAMEFPTEGIIANIEGMKIRTNRISVLREFKGEKVILAGNLDPIVNYMEIKALGEETESCFHSFPNGHLIPIENTQKLFKFV